MLVAAANLDDPGLRSRAGASVALVANRVLLQAWAPALNVGFALVAPRCNDTAWQVLEWQSGLLQAWAPPGKLDVLVDGQHDSQLQRRSPVLESEWQSV